MDLPGLMEYAQGVVLKSIEGLAEAHRENEPACGSWSAKDVLGHLGGFKLLVVDVLSTFCDNSDTPYLKQMLSGGGDSFGEAQVTNRKNQSFQDNLNEYKLAHQRMMILLAQIPEPTLHQKGTLPWYGSEYALDDFILYTDFGHQIEHSSQLALLRDRVSLATS